MTILTQCVLFAWFFNYNLDGSLARLQRLHKCFMSVGWGGKMVPRVKDNNPFDHRGEARFGSELYDTIYKERGVFLT